MSPAQIAVTIGGVVLIVVVNWYFFVAESKTPAPGKSTRKT